jgi:hypothetical protein
MKTFGYAFVFAIIGGIAGALVGSGQTNYETKSQREIAFPIYAIGGALCGLVGGLIVGSKIGSAIEVEEKLGFDKQETIKYKVGRKWEYETTFINPATGNKNSIKTAYSKEHETALTYFNDVPILNHESKSGADDKIQKAHTSGAAYV